MNSFRKEKDTMGIVEVPAEKLWGASTQRSLNNFKIGDRKMPMEIIYAYSYIKKASAFANFKTGVLTEEKYKLIALACDEILEGQLDEHFPLVVWQTGSGTQTNMNVNEVIANRAHVLNGGELTDTEKVMHQNDDVNKSQSTNDTFPAAINIAAYKLCIDCTLPSLEQLHSVFRGLRDKYAYIVKIGRTHCMDATPLTVGQEFSGYVSQLENGIRVLKQSLYHVAELPLGGSAVGTGINVPDMFSNKVVSHISELTELPFVIAKNNFEAMSSHDAIVELSGALKQISVSLMKIANDIRMLASGPRSGIGEFILPANEPGSSIMPGKVNPTQIEALTMVCAQVIGNDTAITIGGMQGHFQLNVFKPLIAVNIIDSLRLLGDACISFSNNCVEGIVPDLNRIKENLNKSLMLVTALAPHIGYEKSAEIAKKAYNENLTLKQAAIELNYISEEEFDKIVDVDKMVS